MEELIKAKDEQIAKLNNLKDLLKNLLFLRVVLNLDHVLDPTIILEMIADQQHRGLRLG